MCHFLNTLYTCTPPPRPARLQNHTTRTSLLCSNPTPCPLPLWETRTLTYPFPCPACTGETTPFEPPCSDTWAAHPPEAHEEAVTRYLTHLLHLLHALLLSTTPSSTASDFLAAYPTLRSETLCRQHGDHPETCACQPTGSRSWLYNLSTNLRATTSGHVLQAFLSNHVIPAAIAGPLHDEVTSTVEALAARCEEQDFAEEVSVISDCTPPEAHIHSSLDPTRPLSQGTVFSEQESGRRLDHAISAQELVLSSMLDTLAPLPWHVGKTAEPGMLIRLQIARTFCLFPVVDPGLSPLRADMVVERLATLIADPVLMPDCPVNLTDTRRLIAALVPHFHPNSEAPLPNPFTPLYDALAREVDSARARHTHELCAAMHANLTFRNALWQENMDEYFHKIKNSLRNETLPWNRDKWASMAKSRRESLAKGIPAPARGQDRAVRCPLADQDRCHRPVRAANHPEPDADPQDWHVPRVMVRGCGHVLGRRCAFIAGFEAARGTPHAWTCPACHDEREKERAAYERYRAAFPTSKEAREGKRMRKRTIDDKWRHGGPERAVDEEIVFKWPMSAAMNGELERAVLGQLQMEVYPGTIKRKWPKKRAKEARERARAEAEGEAESEAETEDEAEAQAGAAAEARAGPQPEA